MRHHLDGLRERKSSQIPGDLLRTSMVFLIYGSIPPVGHTPGAFLIFSPYLVVYFPLPGTQGKFPNPMTLYKPQIRRIV